MASNSWRPAPWYGEVWEAGDDENGLSSIGARPYIHISCPLQIAEILNPIKEVIFIDMYLYTPYMIPFLARDFLQSIACSEQILLPRVLLLQSTEQQ